ncbi:MAG: hypothetical protein Q9166_002510 [cf. Caloplaca sp. 2 TL-2023]
MEKSKHCGVYEAADVSRDILPVVIDRLVQTDPEGVFVTLSTQTGNQIITNWQYANAINGVAWWLEHHLGKGHKDEGLAYFGTGGGDVFYAILMMGAVKAGYHMIFNSPRNSVDAHVNLFVLQDCGTLIVPEPRPPYLDALLAAYPMRILQVPRLNELLNGKSSYYIYNKSFEEARRDSLVSLHTSGSTGLPKPVIWTLGSAAVATNAYQAPTPEGTMPVGQVYKDDLMFSGMPMFHAAGLVVNVFSPVYSRHRIILPPPGPFLSADNAISLIKSSQATAAVLPPSTLDDISRRPDLLETLRTLSFVATGGGILTSVAGEAITARTKMLNVLGTTESGAFSQRVVDQEDWAYINFCPSAGIKFEHYSDDEYELVVYRDANLERYQPCFEIFPNLQTLSSHDLFAKHPTKPDLWLYRGRSDDIISFLNGEKTNPTSMEGLISSLPEVKSALVFGQGRLEAALLIEPSRPVHLSTDEKAKFIENIWPTIEKANNDAPAYARVSKSHILFTTPKKPMSRAGKGTVQRKATIASYSAEIDALYSDADSMRNRDVLVHFDINDLERSVSRVIASTTGFVDLGSEDDFFAHGMDSLQVIQAARSLRLGLESTGIKSDGLAPSTVYTRPTITKLVAAIRELTQDFHSGVEADQRARTKKIVSLTDKYSALLDAQEPRKHVQRRPTQVVMLTGSTGALGSYLLEVLAASAIVTKIYCLNRSPDAAQQRSRSSQSQRSETQLADQHIEFLTCDFSKSDLGLGHQTYQNVLTSIDLIIHNAWQVDFNLSLESYEQIHIQGVHNLIQLSAQSTRQPRIFFISSIAAVMNWPLPHHEGRKIPEEISTDFTVPQPMGYAESKFVAEQLLANANKKCNIHISICRVGQIAGPVLGSEGRAWNKNEWFPSLVVSSMHLGMLPERLGKLNAVDWIPIDILADIIMDLALIGSPVKGDAGVQVYHAVNPSATTWDALLPSVQSRMHPMPTIVSLGKWVAELRAKARTDLGARDLQDIPAIKLVESYEGLMDEGSEMGVLATEKTLRASHTIRDLGPVTGNWMTKWMDQWNRS